MTVHGETLDVFFDYEACLGLARQLWALAEEVASIGRSRHSLAGVATGGFLGAYARQFSAAMDTEQANFADAAQGLRNDAMDLAGMWKQAMDEQNRRLHGRHVDQVKASRDALQTAWDDLFGFPSPPPPHPVAIPQPPLFAPTAEFVRNPAPVHPAPRPVR